MHFPVCARLSGARHAATVCDCDSATASEQARGRPGRGSIGHGGRSMRPCHHCQPTGAKSLLPRSADPSILALRRVQRNRPWTDVPCSAPLRFARSASQKSFSACCPAPQSAEPKAAVTRPPAHACVCGCSRSGVVACIYRARRRHCAHRARAAGHHCVGAVCFPFPHRRAPGMSLATAAGGVGSASQSQNRTEEGVPFVINAAAGTRTRMSMTPHGHGGRPDRPSPIAASSALPCRVIRALFSSKKFCKTGTVALSFVFDKYYPIIH